jgi:hypothetical protein
MSDLSLQERLMRYFKNRPGEKVAKERLAEKAKEATGATGETVGRRLRILAAAGHLTIEECEEKAEADEYLRAKELLEGGLLMVEEVGPSRHAHYWYVPPTERRVRKVRFEGDRAIEYYETIKL